MAINNPGNLSKDYILMNNIDAEGETFTPIGNFNDPFTGTFDGNGYTISNITLIEPMTDDLGLFGYTEDASISNLSLKSINLKGGNYVGSLIGWANNTSVNQCFVENPDTCLISGQANVGGLVGEIWFGEISESYVAGNVEGAGNNVGGLVGYMEMSEISESYATGNVEGTGNNVGGFVGYTFSTVGTPSISNSYATGNVSGTNNVGGFGGCMIEFYIYDSYATGNVRGTNNVGGFVGYMEDSEIYTSYATGNAIGTDNVGGFGGGMNGFVSNSYATGNATGTDNVGGFGGYMYYSDIYTSYATGNATGTNDVGGFVGEMDIGTVITDSFYIGSPDSLDNTKGIRVASSKLMQISTFTVLANAGGYVSAAWDMSSSQNRNFIWYIDEGNDYPKINWNYDPQTEQQKGGSGTGSATIIENQRQATPIEPVTPQPATETISSTEMTDSTNSIDSENFVESSDSGQTTNSKRTQWALIIVGTLIVVGCVGYYLYRKQ